MQKRDFKRDPDDPEKIERYQAEALVHRHVPTQALLGVVCYTDAVKNSLDHIIAKCGLGLRIAKRTGWYFR